MTGTTVGAILSILLIALGVAVVAIVAVAVGHRVRLPWLTWVLSVAALGASLAALWAAVAPAQTVDGVTCLGSAGDLLVGDPRPDDPAPEECLEEARVQVAGWLFILGVTVLIWAVSIGRTVSRSKAAAPTP